jgi:hypothetical protein
MSEGAGRVPAKTLLQYQGPLLRLSAGNAAKLLEYQSSLLRLCADAAPGPWFEYQRFLLRFWAGAYELVARNCENGLAFFSTTIEQRRFGMPRPNSTVSELEQDNKPIIDHEDNKLIIDQMSDLASETAGTSAQTRTVEADQPKTAATNQKIAGANARKKITKAANARKKMVKKTSKALAKTGRK